MGGPARGPSEHGSVRPIQGIKHVPEGTLIHNGPGSHSDELQPAGNERRGEGAASRQIS